MLNLRSQDPKQDPLVDIFAALAMPAAKPTQLRIKSLVRAIMDAAVAAQSAIAPQPHESSDFVEDPMCSEKVALQTAYKALYKILLQSRDRPHERVLGRIYKEVLARIVRLYPLAKVCSEADAPKVHEITKQLGASVFQLEETSLDGKLDFLQRLFLLLEAYVTAAAGLEHSGISWCNKQDVIQYLDFVKERLFEERADLQKVIVAERRTRESWNDLVAHHGATLGQAIRESPDRCGRFWNNTLKPEPAPKQAVERDGRKRKLEGQGKGGKSKGTSNSSAKGQGKGGARITNLHVGNKCLDYNLRQCSRGEGACSYQHQCAVEGCATKPPHPAKACSRAQWQ